MDQLDRPGERHDIVEIGAVRGVQTDGSRRGQTRQHREQRSQALAGTPAVLGLDGGEPAVRPAELVADRPAHPGVVDLT